MSSSPLDVMDIAERLQVEVDNEAALRSAVSRAYYAALLTADQTFPHRDNANQGGESSHEKIIARAQVYGVGANPGRGPATSVAKLLPKIKRVRVKSDYHLGDTVSETECQDTVVRAKQVISWCDEVTDRIQKTASAASERTVPQPTSGKPSLTRIR